MSKTAHLRYLAIDRALRRNPDGISWQQLAHACYESFQQCGIENFQLPSRRTIMDDIRTLRNGTYGPPAPIEYHNRRGYRYTEKGYAFQVEPLGREDFTTLLNLVDWAEQLTYGQLPAGFSETIHRLANHLRTSVRAQNPSIQLDRPGSLDGRENLQPLHHAILARQAVRVNYQEYLAEAQEITLSPYLLKEYNRRWFVLAYDHETRQLWTYPLDRITSVTELSLTAFYDASHLQPLQWLDPIVGVIRPPAEPAVTIKLRATPLQACYLRTKPLHRTQAEVSAPGAARPEFTLTIIPNPELEMQLLSFGDAVEVVEPTSLRERIAVRLQNALALYA
ncbi:WYL domain-containing protein [Neolewinella lacunae]|uniref:WYL domain-containing protein n=1 Tax=Neolewinella lacunae TaxID=1517758 RepID=A0A923PM53_9BACT|nr:WYL domain-containing protein [Neolewinella lacunae]MBC6995241.1 WYL domain-containing protein [Neolewinella lacunae]MDN3635450.1 WYL domain-containing protein [Neolewinella lacunae]